MKIKTALLVSAAALALQFTPVSYAQSPDAQGHEGRGRHGRHARLLANLSPEERMKLRAAHQKAMADPALQAAKDRKRQAAREFRDLRRAKMLQADPSIQSILDKMPARGRGQS